MCKSVFTDNDIYFDGYAMRKPERLQIRQSRKDTLACPDCGFKMKVISSGTLFCKNCGAIGLHSETSLAGLDPYMMNRLAVKPRPWAMAQFGGFILFLLLLVGIAGWFAGTPPKESR